MPAKTEEQVTPCNSTHVRLVTLEQVREAIEAKPGAVWYDTDKQEDIAGRLGFTVQQYSDVFYYLKQLRHEGRLRRESSVPPEPRVHKRGNGPRDVLRVTFTMTANWDPKKPPVFVNPYFQRSGGYFVRRQVVGR